jgi:hypothetical protein
MPRRAQVRPTQQPLPIEDSIAHMAGSDPVCRSCARFLADDISLGEAMEELEALIREVSTPLGTHRIYGRTWELA